MAKRKVNLILQLVTLFLAITVVNLQAITGIRARHCTGEKMDIRCDPGYRVTISRVYFGLKSDRQCATGRRAYSENCCARTDRLDCIFFETDIQNAVNDLCSGQNSCRPSARGIPARNKCRGSTFAETDRTDFKTVIYDCIPDDATVDLCSDKQESAPSLYISSPQYPTPMRAGPSNCTCMAVSPGGVNAYALDFAFPDTDSVCEKELIFHEGTRNKIAYGCNRPLSAQRQMYRGREENLTISLINNDADKGYAWILLKPGNPSEQVRLYCGKALEDYLYGIQTTTAQIPTTSTEVTTEAPRPVTTTETPRPVTTTEALRPVTTTETPVSTTRTPSPITEISTTTSDSPEKMTTTTETEVMKTTPDDSTTGKEEKMSSAEPEHTTEEPLPETPVPEECQLRKCRMILSSISLNELYFPDKATLDKECSKEKEIASCLKEIDATCSNKEVGAQERKLMMATKAIIKIYCQDHKKDILREQDCFKRVAEDTSAACQKFTAPPMANGKFIDETEEQQCKRILDHKDCITEQVKENCEKVAYDLALVIGEKTVRASIANKDLVCSTAKQPVQGGDDGSTGSSLHKTSLTLIWIFSILYILR